ncbi:MAG: hypothetical protein ABSG03_17155 [Bryobacteraceae bacterium]
MLLTLAVSLAAFESAAQAQGTLSYYFAHIASAGVWRTTFTYVNQTSLPVTCNTSFYSDTGSPLPLSFNGAALSSTSDTIPAGGTARRQTDAQTTQPTATGWASANCTGPVKASALFRSYSGSVAQAEASVPAMTYPANQFVTYADQATGVAYANPSPGAATVTFTARDQTGAVLGAQSISLSAGSHGSQNLGPLLGLTSFQGSITIASSTPIISLSLNAEAAPVISSLPPGQPDGAPATGPAIYYFAHIAAANVWRTTFTYVNASSQAITCNTSFYSDSGSPLLLLFSGSAISSTSDTIPAGGIARRQTDAQPGLPVVTGWAVANCTGPVKASALFREYNGSVAQGEASVIATTTPASQFLTYGDQTTGVAYANPSGSPAKITFTGRNESGSVVGTGSLTLAAGAHSQANLGPLLGVASFQGSVTVTSLEPIVSLSLNAEAYPSFSSLPPGDGASFQVYGAWECSNDNCNWQTVRTLTDFDAANHWMIDRGDGSGLPSLNLVVLSFVQPTKLLNLTNDSQTVNGIPIGMTAAIVNYFTSHNVRVMLALGGATYVTDWDTALTTNASQLGTNAANAAKAMGVGIEIDYENDASPNLTALQSFIDAYRAILPYDPTGAIPAARLTIDLAAGDQYLVTLCQKASADWLTGSAPALDWANATVPNDQPAASNFETSWQQHASGENVAGVVVPALPPAKFTGAVRVVLGSTVEPECNNFAASLQNSTGIFGQTLAPNGAGITQGMLGYMFWGAEGQAPATCEGGVGTGASNYNIPIPPPPLRQQ